MPQDDDENEYEREESMMDNVQKTYLLTDSLITQLPANFVFSTNKKYIEIQNCKLYDAVNKEFPEDVFMHMNLIHEREYLDNNVGAVNQIKTKYKRYEVKTMDEELKLWFTQMRGDAIDIGDPYIYDFTDKQLPKYEKIDLTTLPEYNDLEYLFDFLKVFVPDGMIDLYWEATNKLNVKNAIQACKDSVDGSYYENILTPLWEESFYTNDFLVNCLYDIVSWANALNNARKETPSVGKMVNFFINDFLKVIFYNYDKFGDMPYFPSLGACLAAIVYYEDYDVYDYLDSLTEYTVGFTSTKPDSYFDYALFSYYRLVNNQKYNINISANDDELYVGYWSVVQPYIEKLCIKDAHMLLNLAYLCYSMDLDFLEDQDKCFNLIGKNRIYFDWNFNDTTSDKSTMYFFIELVHLYVGYEQEPLNWQELSSTYNETTKETTAIEIAFDPLFPEWLLTREVKYGSLSSFPSEQYKLNTKTNIYEPQYRFLAEFMLIF